MPQRILLSKTYVKAFNKRIKGHRNLEKKVVERVFLFRDNPTSPILRNHCLVGKMYNCGSFWITGDIRVIYKSQGDDVIFIDIGTHNQVYK